MLLFTQFRVKKYQGLPFFLTASDKRWLGPGNETTFLKWSWHNRQIEKKKNSGQKGKISHILQATTRTTFVVYDHCPHYI